MDLKALAPAGIAFVVIAVVLTIGANIIADVKAEMTAGTYAANAAGKGEEGLYKLANWLPNTISTQSFCE